MDFIGAVADTERADVSIGLSEEKVLR